MVSARGLAGALMQRTTGAVPRLDVQQQVADEFRPHVLSYLERQGVILDTRQMHRLISVVPSKMDGVDFQFNGAFALAKHCRMKPAKIAAGIEDMVKRSASAGQTSSPSPIQTARANSKGFIDIQVSTAWLEETAAALASGAPGAEGWRRTSADKKRVIVDFASPNVGKELHAGHLRSSVIGDTLSRVLEYLGHDVRRLSHVGDLGKPVAMLVALCGEHSLAWASGNVAEDSSLPDGAELSRLYVEAKRLHDGDAEFRARVDRVLRTIQRGSDNMDPHVRKAWLRVCEASRKSYKHLFEQLSVNVHDRPESTYVAGLAPVVGELTRGGVATHSEGAVVIFPPEDAASDAPMVIQKSDSSFLYATIDLACARQRLVEDRADWIVYVTDVGQQLHFSQLFSAVKRSGWATEATRLDHVGFGVVQDAHGKKLSSRDGSPLSLSELLDEARRRSQLVLEGSTAEHSFEKVKEDTCRESESGDSPWQDMLAQAVANSCVRFYDLHAGRRSYKVDFDSMLSFRGNTSVYLQYALVRLRKILRNRNPSQTAMVPENAVSLKEPAERDLALWLAQFDDHVTAAGENLDTHVICDYMHKLARKFHAFYAECRILGSDEEASRVRLCCATEAALSRGMDLLGVQKVDRM